MGVEIASAEVRIRPNFRGFQAATTRGIDKNLNTIATKGTRAGKNLTTKLTLPIAAIGFVAIKSFSQFDDALNGSIAIMGDAGQALRSDLGDTARDVAKSTRLSAKDAADSYFFLASAGLSAQQSIAALPQVAKFAQAGMFDMSTATDLATDAQSALGLTVSDSEQNLVNLTRVTDVLVKANTLANASVEQFSTSLTNKAGTALKLVNKDIEEGAAVLAVYADRGIKGQIAGNNLARFIKGLTINAVKNKDAFKDLGIEVFDSAGEMNSFADITEDLTDALSSMSTQQQTVALGALGFSARQQDVVKTLIGSEDAIRRYEAALRDAGGATEEVANKQLLSFAGQMELVQSRLEDSAITLGSELAPAMLFVADATATLIELMVGLPDPIKNMVLAGLGIAAVAGPLLLVAGSVAKAALAFQGLAASAGTAAVAVGGVGAASTGTAVASGAAALVPGIGLGVGGASAAAGTGVAAGAAGGAGLGLLGAGAAATGVLAAQFFAAGLIQAIPNEEGSIGDAVTDTFANAFRGGLIFGGITNPLGLAASGVGAFFGLQNSDNSEEGAKVAVNILDSIERGFVDSSPKTRDFIRGQVGTALSDAINFASGELDLSTSETGAIGEQLQAFFAAGLDRGFEPEDISALIGKDVLEALAGGVGIPRDIFDSAARGASEATREAGRKVAADFGAAFSIAMAEQGTTISEGIQQAIDSGAAPDFPLIAEIISDSVATLPSIFESGFDAARVVTSAGMLSIIEDQEKDFGTLTDNISTIANLGLVELAAAIAAGGPAAAAEAQAVVDALANDDGAPFRMEQLLRGRGEEGLAAFLESLEMQGIDTSRFEFDFGIDAETVNSQAGAAFTAAFTAGETIQDSIQAGINAGGTIDLSSVAEQVAASLNTVPSIFENVFGKIKPISDVKILELVTAQAAQFATLQENIRIITEAGLTGYAEQIRQAGPGAAAAAQSVVDGLVGGTNNPFRIEAALRGIAKEDIDAFLSEYEGADAATTATAFAAKFTTGITTELNPEDAKTIGNDYTAGLNDGMVEGSDAVTTTAGTIAGDVNDTLAEGLGVESPSTIASAYGVDYMAGLSQGVENGFSGVQSTVSSGASSMNLLLAQSLSSSRSAVAGSLWVAGLERGILRRMDTLLGRVRTKVNEINIVTRSALGISSPSTIAAGFGESYVEGLNVGLRKAVDTVAIPPIEGNGLAGSGRVPPTGNRSASVTIINPSTADLNQDSQRAALIIGAMVNG